MLGKGKPLVNVSGGNSMLKVKITRSKAIKIEIMISLICSFIYLNIVSYINSNMNILHLILLRNDEIIGK